MHYHANWQSAECQARQVLQHGAAPLGQGEGSACQALTVPHRVLNPKPHAPQPWLQVSAVAPHILCSSEQAALALIGGSVAT